MGVGGAVRVVEQEWSLLLLRQEPYASFLIAAVLMLMILLPFCCFYLSEAQEKECKGDPILVDMIFEQAHRPC